MVTFEQYNGWRERLLDLLARTEVAARKLSLTEKANVFSKMQENLKNDILRIQVVGTVKNGKSSFTNALMGKEILPVDDIPCTAVVSEVKYGEKEKAVVHFCSPIPTGLFDEIPKATREYIRKYNDGKDANGGDVQIPPLEIPYNQLDEYVAIPEPSMDILTDEEKLKEYRSKIDQESPYDVAELFIPAELLKNGTEIIDSPGLNESPKRTIVTLNYLEKADAVIYLLDASHPITLEEKKVVEKQLLELGFTDMLMVANRIDLVRNKNRQILYIKAQVQGYTSNKEVFGVSAKQALEGIKDKNKELLDESGIPQFKEFLIDYLTRKKGCLKLKKPANHALNTIKKEIIGDEIPKRMAALDADSVELQARLNSVVPELEALKGTRDNMKNTMEKNIGLAINPIQVMVHTYFDELANKIDSWVNNFTPTTTWTIIATKADIKKVTEEIIEHIKEKIQEDFGVWGEKTFQPKFKEQADIVFGSMEADINEMAKSIDAIDNMLQGLDASHAPSISAAERIAGIAGMLFLPMGRAGGEVFAGGFNLSQFMKTFAVDLGMGLGVGLLSLLVWPPAGLIAIIISIISGLLHGGAKAMVKTKSAVAGKIKDVVKEHSEQQIKDVVNKVRGTFESIKDSVLKGLDAEIDNVTARVKEIENITKKGQDSIAEKRKLLADTKKDLVDVLTGLDKLKAEVDVVN